ncbi:hypothetical protein [Geminocystis herdmanii]|uniref:hypothetical protein n=1 Tax=Geminocystis herdmanii TaxID=669359 RepID=UPI00034D2449|nr:hypothetical protein [Geminocystis herdmanii]
MSIDNDVFLELNHELIKPLHNVDDLELWILWQKYPQQSRYLIMLFFRYADFPQKVAKNFHNLELSLPYLENLWFFMFDRLLNYNLEKKSLLSEIITQLVNEFLTAEKIIVTSTNKSDEHLEIRFFPLKYYLQKNLDKLSNIERIILLTKDKFNWENEKILDYLQQQKQTITLAEIKAYYTQAHSRLLNFLPIDIVSIYL